MLECEKWHKYQLEAIIEAKGAIILWDVGIQTDKKIKSNRPDIIVKDKNAL